MNTTRQKSFMYVLLGCYLALSLTNEILADTPQKALVVRSPEIPLGTLTAKGLTFDVMTYQVGKTPYLVIRTDGLSESRLPIRLPVDGIITGMATADLDEDGYAEIFIFIQSNQRGAAASIIAYASNRNRSLSPIYLNPLDDNHEASLGYRGYDHFQITDSRLERSFPVYGTSDNLFSPQGGTRTLRYSLSHEETGWRLNISRIENTEVKSVMTN